MRIAYLSTSILPSRTANSVHVMRMCSALTRLGHEVVLVAPHREKEAEKGIGGIRDYYGGNENFGIVRLPWGRYRGKSLAYAIRSGRFIRNWKPDLILSRFLMGTVIPSLAGFPVVFESHQPLWHYSRFDFHLLTALARLPSLRRIVVISEALAEAYRRKAPRLSAKLAVVPDAADEPKAGSGAAHLSRNPTRLQIGYVGNLYAGKGMEVIERVAPLVPEADFHVVGGYPADIEHWRNRIGSGNVRFHGHIPPAQVPNIIRAMDICLLPNLRQVMAYGANGSSKSIGEYTSPLKLFEYMANSKPIIASDLSILREVLDDTNALFADPDDPAQWAAAVHRLSDAALRETLGRKAHADFLEKHTWTRRAERVLEGVAV